MFIISARARESAPTKLASFPGRFRWREVSPPEAAWATRKKRKRGVGGGGVAYEKARRTQWTTMERRSRFSSQESDLELERRVREKQEASGGKKTLTLHRHPDSQGLRTVSGAVLVTAAAAQPEEAGEDGGEGVWCGGSGFVLNGVVLTSAMWLAGFLKLRGTHSHYQIPDSIPTGVEWELVNPDTAFHVVYETKPDHKRTTEGPRATMSGPKVTTTNLPSARPNIMTTTNRPKSTTKGPKATTKRPAPTTAGVSGTTHERWSSSGLSVVGARVVYVLLLEGVYGCLVGQMETLAQWRCEMESVCVGGRGEGGGGELVSIQSLLLPLSCVVVFAVEGLPRPSLPRLPRSVSLTGISFCVIQ